MWKRGAKGYLIDTVARGLPIPLIFVRERVDLDTQEVKREIVDGQQRLRTLFAFIDPDCLVANAAEREWRRLLRNHQIDVPW